MKISSEGLGNGGDRKVAHGKYHMIVNNAAVATYENKDVGFELEVEILDGTVPEQSGKTMKFQTFRFDWDSFFDLAAALGVTNHATGEAFTTEQLKADRAAKKAGKPLPDYDFDPAEYAGLQFFADVVPEKKKDGTVKDFPRIGHFIVSIADERAKDIPRNQQMIDEVLGGVSEAQEADPLLS